MSRFEIVAIGEELDPAAGIPEGCELCGHCTVMRHVLAEGAALPCGATLRSPRDRPTDLPAVSKSPRPTTHRS